MQSAICNCPMPNPLKLASLWRVIKDLDLEGLRAAARGPFTLALASEQADDAAGLRRLLTGPDAPPHPWIEIAALGTSAPAFAEALRQPGTSAPQRSAIDALSALSGAPIAGILITRDANLSDALKLAGNRFATSSTPVLTVVVGDTSRTAKVLRPGEQARVAVDALDAAGGRRRRDGAGADAGRRPAGGAGRAVSAAAAGDLRAHHRPHGARQRQLRAHDGAGRDHPRAHRAAEPGRHGRAHEEPVDDVLSAGAGGRPRRASRAR